MRRSPTLRHAHLAVVLAGAALSVATSKVESGDREPDCPTGERCSDATPNGLYFGGTPTGDVGLFADEWPKTIAVGGTQTIRIYRDADAETSFELPFVADVPAHLTSLGAGASSIELRADEAGRGKLRVLEPDTELLYDRVDIDAAVPVEVTWVAAGDDVLYDAELLVHDKDIAVLAGSGARVTAAAYSDGGDRVIDEGMTFAANGGVAADPEGFVDTISVTHMQPGSLDVGVRLGDTTVPASLRVVGGADDIVAISVGSVSEGGERDVCVRAENRGDAVLGADYSFAITDRASLRSFAEAAHCVTVIGESAGAATLTVTAAGVTRTFDVEVVAADSSARLAASPFGAAVPEESVRAVEGERAFLSPISGASTAATTGW